MRGEPTHAFAGTVGVFAIESVDMAREYSMVGANDHAVILIYLELAINSTMIRLRTANRSVYDLKP